jgi:hypothetical protein
MRLSRRADEADAHQRGRDGDISQRQEKKVRISTTRELVSLASSRMTIAGRTAVLDVRRSAHLRRRAPSRCS